MKEYFAALLGSNFRNLALLLGVGLLLLGLAGGIRYKNLLVIDIWQLRSIAAVAGAALVLAALSYLSRDRRPQFPNKESFNLQISEPRTGDRPGSRVDVRGTILRKDLPEGFKLRAIRGYPQGGFIPHGHITFESGPDPKLLYWQVKSFEVGGQPPNDPRSIEIWLVGEDGEALLQCWLDSHEIHRQTNEDLKTATGKYGKWLNPIKRLTTDMVQWAKVDVYRDKP